MTILVVEDDPTVLAFVMSSQRHFVWAFVIVTIVTTIACAFAVWLVYHLTGS